MWAPFRLSVPTVVAKWAAHCFSVLSSGFLAASYAQLGRIDEASSALGGRGLFTVERIRRIMSASDPDVLERFVDGVRKAGMQE